MSSSSLWTYDGERRRKIVICGLGIDFVSLFLQVFNSVEIKPEMTGHYLGEFSCSYRPVKHGRPGVCVLHLLPPGLVVKS